VDFKSDFLAAFQGGKDYHALMDLVRRYRTEGLSSEAAYEALEEIWLGYGFDDSTAEEGTLQDTLETVMEKVWYGQRAL
jgi:hypothetical protein